MPRPEFAVHKLNEGGLAAATELAESFSELLNKLEQLVPPGRPRSIAITHLQDACFWAKRGLAEQPAYQEPEKP